MKKENDNKVGNRRPYKHRTLRYGMLTLAVLIAAVIAVQMVPGGTEDTSAADITIILDTTSTGEGYSWSGSTLTITSYDNNYSITQNATSVLERNIIIKDSDSSSTVTITIKNINIRGDITLEGDASVKLFLEGTNKISGSVLVPKGSTTEATITIDSLTNGSLNVTATSSYYAGIGGSYGAGGTITISGGIVIATSGAVNGGGAGIGGGNGGNGGTITINGGTVTATGGTGGGAGIGGGNGGNGGNIVIAGGTVTATGSGAGIGGGYNSGAGAALTIKNEASVKAFSTGNLPAIHADSITNSAGTGFFVNAVNSSPFSASTKLLIYADGDTTTELATLTLPGNVYNCFAFMLPGSSSSKNYNIFAQNEGGSRPMLKSSDDSPIITSVNTVEYTNVKRGDLIIAVTDISDVPDKAVVGTPLTLSGTVNPSDATYPTITWSVESAGATGAVIEDGVLTASDVGAVTVKATIAHGTSPGTDYTEDFTITVSAEETKGSGGGSNMMLWIGIAAVIIILLILTVFLLQKKGIIKGI